MEKTELTFEIGGLARHLTFNKSKDLLILNLTEKEVLTRYANEGVFYTQSFFKHELEPHTKSSSKPHRGILIR